MSALVFMDTETTGLSLDDDIWEFAGIRREEDGTENELHLFIQHDERRCKLLPESFRADHEARYPHNGAVSRHQAATDIWAFTGGKAHIVGAVPNFDTERIAILLSAWGLTPQWHYHLIDIENLAVGFLSAASHYKAEYQHVDLSLPWKSDDLSRALGVEPPEEGVRHTAMGDARWARDVYDAAMWRH